MARPTYACELCGKRFKREDVLPPVGTMRPVGVGWRCKRCHQRLLKGEFSRLLKGTQ